MIETMARPPKADPEATRARIRQAAAGLFARFGVDGVSVRQIAREAGVSVAMISHHFGGKEPLYRACLDAMYGELSRAAPEVLAVFDEDARPTELVERTLRLGFRHAREHRAAIRLVMRHVLDSGEIDPVRRETLLVPFVEAASSVLATATGRSRRSLRFALQSVFFLLSRYAVASDRELAVVGGIEDEQPEVVMGMVEDAVVGQALALLGLG